MLYKEAYVVYSDELSKELGPSLGQYVLSTFLSDGMMNDSLTHLDRY